LFQFEELDDVTRRCMLEEFRAEWSTNPDKSPRLSAAGLAAFPGLMEAAILNGNEVTLARALANRGYWRPSELYARGGRGHARIVNPAKAAQALAITEFNTWYVRGLSRKLIEEGEKRCEVYRADAAWQPRAECLRHDRARYDVHTIFDGHRARYWPPPGDTAALSIPVGPNCHHTIRRIPRIQGQQRVEDP